ncbi:MAG: hypothetical protein K6F40_10195 [Bacteroidales bacterium]|nr:hypothetical protein [Bacteroidales bacterium]
MDSSSRYDPARPLLRLGAALRDAAWVKAHLEPLFPRQYQQHSWFTPAFCQLAVKTLGEWLQENNLRRLIDWLGTDRPAQRIALIPDGKTPLSGFRELIFILAYGHNAVVRTVPHDLLLPVLVKEWGELDATIGERVILNGKLSAFDAVVADLPAENAETLQRYFASFPHLLRSSCCQATLLDGEETEEELRNLAHDIYHYFGRSPRATRKLYVPEGYDFVPLLRILQEESRPIADHNQFLNHLDYQKSIRLMSNQYYMDSGTFLLVESADTNPPVAVIHYIYYPHNGEKPATGCHDGENVRSRREGTSFGQAHSAFIDKSRDTELLHFLGRL